MIWVSEILGTLNIFDFEKNPQRVHFWLLVHLYLKGLNSDTTLFAIKSGYFILFCLHWPFIDVYFISHAFNLKNIENLLKRIACV